MVLRAKQEYVLGRLEAQGSVVTMMEVMGLLRRVQGLTMRPLTAATCRLDHGRLEGLPVVTSESGVVAVTPQTVSFVLEILEPFRHPSCSRLSLAVHGQGSQ